MVTERDCLSFTFSTDHLNGVVETFAVQPAPEASLANCSKLGGKPRPDPMRKPQTTPTGPQRPTMPDHANGLTITQQWMIAFWVIVFASLVAIAML